MAYTILNTDGTTLTLLADGQVDQSTTSITLIGRNRDSYGEELNNNLVKMLGNFASVSGNPPRSPLKGQLWYDTSIRRLKVYDNGFKTVGAVEISSSTPTNMLPGDVWFDTTVGQVKMYFPRRTVVIGPAYPSNIGETGLVLPINTSTGAVTTVKEATTQDSKNVILLKSYGSVVGLVHSNPTGSSFVMDSTDALTYMPSTTTKTVVSGVTITEDLKVHGRLSDDYLSMYVNIDDLATIYSLGNSVTNADNIDSQNTKICDLLTAMFPPSKTTEVDGVSTPMPGLLSGTQARVFCKCSNPSNQYQVRVFRVNDNSVWEAWNFGPPLVNVIGV